MEIDFIEEKENKLFNRKEIKFYVDYDGEATPKVLDIKSKLVALLNTKKDLIVGKISHYYKSNDLSISELEQLLGNLTNEEIIMLSVPSSAVLPILYIKRALILSKIGFRSSFVRSSFLYSLRKW